MSVLVSDRKESQFEVIVHADELRNMMIELAHRRFGIKDLEHLVRVQYAYGKLKSEDIEYYLAVLNCAKRNIMNIAALMTNYVRAANSVYPVTEEDWQKRRDFQNSALVNCELLVKELQHIVTLFNVDVNIYGRYITAIDREIHLIKRWRQKDGQIMSVKRAASKSASNFANVNNNGNATNNTASNTNYGVRPDSLFQQ